MSFLRHWKVALALLALFAVGIVTGSVLTVAVVKAKLKKERENNQDWTLTTYRMYKERLDLTPEQEAKLKPVFERAGKDLRDIRRQTMMNIMGVIRQVNREVEVELTPEQKEKFQKLREQLRNRLEGRKKGPGPGGVMPKGPFQRPGTDPKQNTSSKTSA